MSEDVLETYDAQIYEATKQDRGYESARDDDKQDAIRDLAAEVRALRAWVADLQSGMYVNCVYCGHRYGPGESTPVSMADALKAHIETCPKHPMSALKARVAELEKEQEGTLADWAADLDRLEARVAELEPDARLGKMVREMPYWHELQHWGMAREGWIVKNFIKHEEVATGRTPEAALEAAQKDGFSPKSPNSAENSD